MTGMKDLGRLGRGTDSLVIHANPWEAMLLAAHGGSGTINPATGLLQFEDDSGTGNPGGGHNADGGGTSSSPSGDSPSGDSPSGSTGIGGNTSFGGWSNDPSMRSDAPESEIGEAAGGVNWSEYSMLDTRTVSQAEMDALTGAAGLAERTALANNKYDPTHPAVARGRAIDEGTLRAQSLLDRLAEAFNPVRTDPVSVVNSVVSTVAAPVGLAMTVGRALSEYALDQGWSIDYSYDSVMSGGDTSERAQDLRQQIAAATGQPTPTPTPTPTAPVPEVAVTTSVPGYRSLLGDGYDGFRFLETSQGVNRSTRRFA